MAILRRTHTFHWGLALLLALGVMLLMQPLTARAEAITVTSTLDSGAGTLRQAIADVAPGDTIVFSGSMNIYLSSELSITKTLTIDGSGYAITLSGDSGNDGSRNVRVFNIGAGGDVTLSHLNIVSGTATNGGGIYNAGTVQVTHSRLSDNSAAAGGGIYNAGGTATVAECTLAGNTATNYGGGLYTNGGTATVIASTLVNNRITQSNFCMSGYGGGGLYNNGGNLTVRNSTLANNAAATNCGGGLYNAGTTTVQASTLSSNSGDYGGGIWNHSGTLSLSQTIVANSGGTDCSRRGPGFDEVYSGDSLFEETGWNACGDYIHYNSILGVDPLLGPLADYGGSTQTFALLPGSPAIDGVQYSSCLAADQRGAPRADLSCDIGAYELQYAESDTVIKSGMIAGKQASFGPTRVRVTVTGGNAGTITATKHLVTPGGAYNTGEIAATWWITASASPFTATLAFCYTPAEVAGLTESRLQAFRWDGLDWTTPISTGLTVADGCITLTGIEAFSAWTLKDVSVGAKKPTALGARGLAGQAGWPLLAGLLLVLGGAAALTHRRR